ncbi:MAG TPA: Rnase Y domain-containing protein, partial [Actinomycetota bacterium]|nr:Rnase Y domain-containing protein [Actinomycetota bacterium]
MNETGVLLVAAILGGVGIGYLIRKMIGTTRVQSAEARAQKLLLDAEREAESVVRQSLREVKEEIAAMRREAEADIRGRREELKRGEERLAQREQTLDRKLAEVEERTRELDDRDRTLRKVREELEKAAEQHRHQLERLAGMTAQEAREALMGEVIDEAKRRAMATVREIEQRAREEGEERARKILTIAIQRVASEQTSESTVSVFALPSEDMKGRIIGREGRNIRAFEAVTGVNLIIDDTPESVVLSSFD